MIKIFYSTIRCQLYFLTLEWDTLLFPRRFWQNTGLSVGRRILTDRLHVFSSVTQIFVDLKASDSRKIWFNQIREIQY